MGGYGDLYHTITTPLPIGQSPVPIYIINREFGIKPNRYANCRIAPVGKIVISLLGVVLFKKHGNLTPSSPINHSVGRIFIVSKMRLLSPDYAILH